MLICWGLEPSHFLKCPTSRRKPIAQKMFKHFRVKGTIRYWCVQTKCLKKFQITEELVATCRVPKSEFQRLDCNCISFGGIFKLSKLRIWTDSFLLKIQSPTCAEVVTRMPGFGPQYGSRSKVTQSKFSAKRRQSERSKAQWF